MRVRARLGAVILLASVGGCAAEAELAPPPPLPPPPPPAPAPAPAPVTTSATPAEPARPPVLELMKRAFATYNAAFNAHDGKKAAEIYAVDAVVASPGPTGMEETKGREGVERMHAGLFAALPDVKVATERVFVKGDFAAQQWASSGTHKGDFMGMKASNRAVGMHAITLNWFDADGLVKRDHTYFDAATIAVQAGAQKGRARPVPTFPKNDGEWIVASGVAEEDKNVETMKAFWAAFEKKDEKAYLEVLAEDVLNSNMNEPDDKRGKKAAKDEFNVFLKAFPDMKMTPQNFWGVGNYVVAEGVFSGTHKGALGPIKPTNKSFSAHFVDVVQFKDGKIVQATSYSSSIEMMGKLGLLQPPKAPETKPATKPAGTGTGTPKPAAASGGGPKPPEAKKDPTKPSAPPAPAAPKSTSAPIAPKSSATPAAPKPTTTPAAPKP